MELRLVDNKMKKIALYARVSTAEQKEGKNIDSQLQELRLHASQNNWEIFAEYLDEGWSGSLIARPALDQLRNDARENKFEAVLINDLDRLGRDTLLLAVVMRDLEKAGVQVIFRKIPPENSPTHTLLLNILGSFAQFEREMISDRFRRGRKYRAEIKKLVVTPVAPYGFKYILKDKEKNEGGHFEIVKNEADIVKKVFGLIKSGLTERGVVRKLKELGLKARNGKCFGRSTVHKILTNESYLGVWHYNKHQTVVPKRKLKPQKYQHREKCSQIRRPREDWLAVPLPFKVVDKDDFDLAQRRLVDNKVYSPRNTKNFYLLRGLLKCGFCSSLFYADNSHGHPGYRCGNRQRSFPNPPTCSNPRSVSANVIEPYVWDITREIISDPRVIIGQAERYSKQHSEFKEDDLLSTKKELARLANEERRIIAAYREEILTAGQLKEQLGVINSLKVNLEQKQKELPEKDKVSSNLIEDGVGNLCKDLATVIGSLNPEEKQKVLRLLLTEIVFEKKTLHLRGAFPISEAKSNIAPTAILCKDRPGPEKLCLPAPFPGFYQH